MKKLTQFKKTAIQNWNDFWFKPLDLLPVSLFRFLFLSFLFVFYGVRYLDYDVIYTDMGFLPYRSLALIIPKESLSALPLEWLVKGDPTGRILYFILLIGLLLWAFGLLKRKFTFLVFLLHLAFFKRNPLMSYGADMVATFWLMYLCLVKNDQVSPLTSLFKMGRLGDSLSTVGCRFIQIQLCIIYAYAGIDKAQSAKWWQGSVLWDIFSNPQITPFDLTFLHHVPVLLVLFSLLSWFWEIYFPVLVWLPKWKPWVLGFGLGMHTTIAFAMGLPFFSLFMALSYLLFIPAQTLEGFLQKLLKRLHLNPTEFS